MTVRMFSPLRVLAVIALVIATMHLYAHNSQPNAREQRAWQADCQVRTGHTCAETTP